MSPMSIKWDDSKARAAAKSGGAAGLQKWADELLAASQPEVPVSPLAGGGFLRDSGKAEVDAGALQAAVSYDGPGDKPALPIWVHENMAVQHSTGKAKFLEDPLNGSTTSGPAAVASEIRSRLG